MRELAKAMMRFSWAMSVFGLEQMRKLVIDEYAGRRADEVKGAFDSLSKSTGRLFSQRSLALYEAGDKLQQESVDLLYDFMRPGNWKADKVVERAADVVDRSADALHDWARAGESKDKPAGAPPRDDPGKQAKRSA